MAFIPLRIPAGMFRNGTKYASMARWYAGTLVRFIKDIVRPVGGWAYQSAKVDGAGNSNIIQLTGIPRGALGWEVGGGRSWQAYGTASKDADGTRMYLYSLGSIYDITLDPYTLISADDASGSGAAPDEGLLVGAQISRSAGAYVSGSVNVRRLYTTEFYSDNFEYYADVQRAPVGAGEPGIAFLGDVDAGIMCMIFMRRVDEDLVDIKFERFTGSHLDPAELEANFAIAYDAWVRFGVRIVAGVATGYRADAITGDNEVDLGPITITGGWIGNATYRHMGLVQHAATVGPVSWDNLTISEYTGPLAPSNEDTTYGTGSGATYWGQGLYGAGAYGSGNPVGSVDEADIWHLDNFGNLLVACQAPTNDNLWWADPSDPTTAMERISDIDDVTGSVPTGNAGLVVTPERFLVALGADGDARKLKWADRESLIIWAGTASNEAGDYLLEGKGKIMAGRRGRAETLIWTDSDLFSMRYVGGTFVYGFEKRATNCGLVAPLAVAEINGAHVWMGLRGFYIYDGYVRSLDCEVEDYVFDDMNRDQRIKVNSFVNHEFKEVWWFYPSSSSTEIDRYVIWNYLKNHWSFGELDRTCGINSTTTTLKPILLNSNGYVFLHESGWDHTIEQAADHTPYVESGPVEIGSGDQVMHLLQVIPDEKTLGDVQAELYVSSYPMASETLVGPFTVAARQDSRTNGRWTRLKLTELSADDWRVGTFRLDVVPGGRR